MADAQRFEHQDIRDAVYARVRAVMAAGMTPEAAAGAVVKLFYGITEEIRTVETTTYGDAFEQHLWTRVAVCHLGLESGSYQGGPVRG